MGSNRNKYGMLNNELAIQTIKHWSERKDKGGLRILPENKIRTKYSEVTKNKVWSLLRKFPVRKVYEIMERRISEGTLDYWRRRIELGLPMKKIRRDKINHEIEDKVFEWFKKQRAKQLIVRTRDLRDIAAKLLNESKSTKKFRTNKYWAYGFQRRYGLAMRTCNIL